MKGTVGDETGEVAGGAPQLGFIQATVKTSAFILSGLGLYNKEFDWPLSQVLGRELLNPQQSEVSLLFTVGPRITPEFNAKMTHDVSLSSQKDQPCDQKIELLSQVILARPQETGGRLETQFNYVTNDSVNHA